MRLWSLHPRHLDRQGLTGCWRETLLAQAVLAGRTRGYRSHPQLERFRAQPEPLTAVGAYLEVLAQEAAARGYSFDLSRIDRRPGSSPDISPIPVTDGQIDLEWRHLLAKLAQRSPVDWRRAAGARHPEAHPVFEVVPGPVESWERAQAPPRWEAGAAGRTSRAHRPICPVPLRCGVEDPHRRTHHPEG